MSPTHKMPQGPAAARAAALCELCAAIAAARCAVRIAGMRAGDVTMRELLLAVVHELDCAARAASRLGDRGGI